MEVDGSSHQHDGTTDTTITNTITFISINFLFGDGFCNESRPIFINKR